MVDQNESTSAISSTDYSLRLKYINMGLSEWAEVNDWQVLYKEYNMLVSTSTGNASIALPSDWRKLAGPAQITYDGSTTDDFIETKGQNQSNYDGTFKRIEVLGNFKDNYILRVYGATLVSGASVKVPYFTSIQSLVSPANVAEIPNPEYLVKRTIAYIFEAREDPRFPLIKQEAENILRNMIEYENVFSRDSSDSRVKTWEETTYAFHWGED